MMEIFLLFAGAILCGLIVFLLGGGRDRRRRAKKCPWGVSHCHCQLPEDFDEKTNTDERSNPCDHFTPPS